MKLPSVIVMTLFIMIMIIYNTYQPPKDIQGHENESNVASGKNKIKHIIIIMQEDRSFDHYFGTYPGVDGIDGIAASVCNLDIYGKCKRPYHDTYDKNQGGPKNTGAIMADINGGKMDGFVKQRYKECQVQNSSRCVVDVMGYHDYNEIPNYWTYAKEFVLQDRMFSSARAWSLPNHLLLFSGWSARCKNKNSMSCTNGPAEWNTSYAWTDITYLLYKNNISWSLYEDGGSPTDVWFSYVAPLYFFETVRKNKQLDNIKPISKFYEDAKQDTLPSVVWIEPSFHNSEHSPEPISHGQAFVTEIINAVMKSSAWDSSAIFLSWDEFGGFYDHVPPLDIDQKGYGIRVPGLVISPYAKKGYIDHQNLSHDAYLKFIEDVFLNGQRIDPKTDGRPDRRPSVRENVSILGDLGNDFNFTQSPRPPLILEPYTKKK